MVQLGFPSISDDIPGNIRLVAEKVGGPLTLELQTYYRTNGVTDRSGRRLLQIETKFATHVQTG